MEHTNTFAGKIQSLEMSQQMIAGL